MGLAVAHLEILQEYTSNAEHRLDSEATLSTAINLVHIIFELQFFEAIT